MRCTGLEKPPEGDIISEYKWLFIGFVILQVTNWSLALLEVFRVVGPLAYAAMEQTFPLDVSFCLMMFLGTLHNGLISDGRLCFLCRVAFIVDGVSLVANNVFVFRPNTGEAAALAANLTSALGSVPFDDPIRIWGYINAFVWFGAECVLSAWVGINCLAMIRRMLLKGVDARRGSFSTQLLQAYVGILVIQIAFVALAVVNSASATTLDAKVLASKRNKAMHGFSLVMAQSWAFKVALFDAHERTFSEWLQNKGKVKVRWTSYVCGVCAIAFVVGAVVPLVLTLAATDANSPTLIISDLLTQGPLLAVAPNFLFWFFWSLDHPDVGIRHVIFGPGEGKSFKKSGGKIFPKPATV